MAPGANTEEQATPVPEPTSHRADAETGDFHSIAATYGASTEPNAPPQFANSPPVSFITQLAPLPGSGGCAVPYTTHYPPRMQVHEDPYVKSYGTEIQAPGPTKVNTSDPESCCNCYWVILILGILIFPPLFIGGSIGIASIRRWERIAGFSNLVALVVYILLLILVFRLG